MPRIPTYEAPALDLRPTETGVDALEQAARRAGAFYHEAGQDVTGTGQRVASAIESAGNVALKAEENRETIAGAKNFAALVANKTDEWNKLQAQPGAANDPTLKQKFLDQLEPDLEKFASAGFITENGRKFAEAHAAQFRQHMFEKTTADMSRLAGEQAHADTRETQNLLSNNVYNDPSSLDFALKTWEGSINGIVGSSPNLGANAGAVRTTLMEHGREAIVKSAAIGYITKTGQVPSWVTDPKYSKYVNGPELEQFRKGAEQQQKANDYYTRAAAREKKMEADLNVAKGLNDVFTKSVSVDPNDPSKLRIAPNAMQQVLDIVRANPDAPSAASHARTAIDWLEHQQTRREQPVVSDPAFKTSLYNGMFSPDRPTSDVDIYKAEVEGKLSRTDAQTLLQLNKALTDEPLRGPIYQDTMKAAHDAMVTSLPGLPGKDAKGEANYANFLQTFIPDYLAKKRAGTLPANALDINDPSSLISQHMKPFNNRTLAERMNDYTALLGGIGGAIEAAPTTATQLPPLDKRERGKVYPTPAGNMKWTGTGWVKP